MIRAESATAIDGTASPVVAVVITHGADADTNAPFHLVVYCWSRPRAFAHR